MNKEQAIKMLSHCEVESQCYDGIHGTCKGCNQRIALDMAIEALKEGEWLEVDSFESEKHSVTDMRCSLCGKYASIVLPHGNKYVYDFCPNCGADMRASKKTEYEKVSVI